MRSIFGLRTGLFVVLAGALACGGGGGGSGSSSSSSGGGTPPPVLTLFVATQPSGAVAPAAFATQPVVQVRSNGVTNTADNTTVVTVAIVAGTGTAGATLTGTTTATAVAGVATFTNLGISTAGTGYQLGFAATSVTGTTSSQFRDHRASAFAVHRDATVRRGAPSMFSTQPVIQVRSNGVLDTTDNTTVVNASILPGTGTAGRDPVGHHERHRRGWRRHVHEPRHRRDRQLTINCASRPPALTEVASNGFSIAVLRARSFRRAHRRRARSTSPSTARRTCVPSRASSTA